MATIKNGYTIVAGKMVCWTLITNCLNRKLATKILAQNLALVNIRADSWKKFGSLIKNILNGFHPKSLSYLKI